MSILWGITVNNFILTIITASFILWKQFSRTNILQIQLSENNILIKNFADKKYYLIKLDKHDIDTFFVNINAQYNWLIKLKHYQFKTSVFVKLKSGNEIEINDISFDSKLFEFMQKHSKEIPNYRTSVYSDIPFGKYSHESLVNFVQNGNYLDNKEIIYGRILILLIFIIVLVLSIFFGNN